MEICISYESSVNTINLYKRIKPVIDKIEQNDYGTEFESIGIIPSIISKELMLPDWKERKQIWRKKREADIRLIIDYEQFIAADLDTQFLLYVQCVIDSIMVVENRKKGDFQGRKLIADILSELGITQEDGVLKYINEPTLIKEAQPKQESTEKVFTYDNLMEWLKEYKNNELANK